MDEESTSRHEEHRATTSAMSCLMDGRQAHGSVQLMHGRTEEGWREKGQSQRDVTSMAHPGDPAPHCPLSGANWAATAMQAMEGEEERGHADVFDMLSGAAPATPATRAT